jgi:hypothetical protein
MSFRGSKIRQRCVPLAIQLVGEKRGFPNGRACIGKEIDMIQVRRTAEHDSFIFEVVVREGNGETRHHVTMSRCGSARCWDPIDINEIKSLSRRSASGQVISLPLNSGCSRMYFKAFDL